MTANAELVCILPLEELENLSLFSLALPATAVT